MLRDTLAKIIIGFMVLLLVSCEPSPSKKIEGTHDYSNVQFPITVYTYETSTELNNAVKDKSGHGQPVEGLSLWFLTKKTSQMSRCEIHVVVPNGVDDDHTMTWGHELVHCVYGTYHREPK
jgi:type IV pilus biogenesis protein CpaD/CtpE